MCVCVYVCVCVCHKRRTGKLKGPMKYFIRNEILGVLLTQYCAAHKIEKIEMGGAYSAYG